jgi:hypothetical protein
MFTDAIFVSMNKSNRHNDVVDQQVRTRHLRPHLTRENIHYGGLKLLQCCMFINASYHLRRCFEFYGGHISKIVEYLHMVIHHIACDSFTNDSSVCLHLHGSSWRHLCFFFRLDSHIFFIQNENVVNENVSLRFHSGGQRKYGSFKWEK